MKWGSDIAEGIPYIGKPDESQQGHPPTVLSLLIRGIPFVGFEPVVKIGGYPPTVALVRGIPFFGFDPVVKIGGYPPTVALIRGIPFFGFEPGLKIGGYPSTVDLILDRNFLRPRNE